MNRDDEWLENWARRSNEEIAAAWIAYESRGHRREEEPGDDESWWAVDAMTGLSHDDPLRALEICFLIARASERPRVLEMLGAGALEDLLSEDPTLFDAIALEAVSTPGLVEALRSMWQSTIPDEVWAKVQHLIAGP